MNDYGEIIRLERHRRRWSQEKLADQAYVSRDTIYRIERGETTGIEVLESILCALDMRLEVLKNG